MSHRTSLVEFCHVTPRSNLPSIWRLGLQPSFARGAMRVVWVCAPSRRAWSTEHVTDQNGTDDVVVLRIRVPRSWVRRWRRGIWHCSQPIPAACIVSVSLPQTVAVSAA
ncbi:MAG TPA: hypothetical protein VN688_02005 [Gemmataceae bacterium]|nr:hypothetical protein [Gemmataceae bacterium]